MKLFQNYLRVAICIFLMLPFITISDFSVAQEIYPSKAVTFVVGMVAGGATDITARTYASAMEKIWGQPVVVVNKPGAGAAISMEFVKNSSPDGYTLCVYSSPAIVGTITREMPYDFFDDFTQIVQMTTNCMGFVVNSKSPWRSPKDVADYGRENPGKLRLALAGGIGSVTHIGSEEFALRNNFKWAIVPFDGEAPTVTSLLGQHIDAAIMPLVAAGPHIKAGRLKLLSVFFEKRLAEFPDAPTQRELGSEPYMFKLAVYGICGPKNIPTAVKEKISSAVRQASKDPAVITICEKYGLFPIAREGEEWISFLKQACKEQAEIMKRIGLKVFKDYK